MLHLVGILFPHINDDAWSKSHHIGRKHCVPYFNMQLKQNKTKFNFEHSYTQECVSRDNRGKRGLQATSH